MNDKIGGPAERNGEAMKATESAVASDLLPSEVGVTIKSFYGMWIDVPDVRMYMQRPTSPCSHYAQVKITIHGYSKEMTWKEFVRRIYGKKASRVLRGKPRFGGDVPEVKR